MKNFRLFTVCTGFLLFVVTAHVQAQDIKITSKISDVTIYPGGAMVTRQADLNMPAGDHTLILEDIIPQINENTLTVKGQGSADAKIFGAFVKTEYLTESSNDRVKDLQAQIEGIDDQIVDQGNKGKVLDKQRAFLDSIKLFSDQQIPKDLVTKIPTVTDLDQLGQYVAKSFTDIETQGEAVRQKLRELNRKREALANSLDELNSQATKEKRSIAVEVQAIRQGTLTLQVSYFVTGVNWQPVYDARVLFEKKQVDLVMFGLINQSTGEDWENVNLTVSTSRPALGGVMPELSSWTLRPMPPVYYQRNKGVGGVYDAFYGGAMDKEASNLAVRAQVAGAASPMMLKKAEFAFAQGEQRGVNVVFKITKPANVKADGTSQKVPILAMHLPARFEYAATPKLSPYAFLRSEVENNQQATLLPGQVNVFLNGDYVGNSMIVKALGNKEQFDLYLGADEGVTVKRELIEEKSQDVLFANIPSPDKVIRYSYKITVGNYKAVPITLNLYDQVPVSQDEKIKVKDIKTTPDPQQKDYKDRKGVMLWAINLAPKEKKEISYSFAVERPRNLEIEGL